MNLRPILLTFLTLALFGCTTPARVSRKLAGSWTPQSAVLAGKNFPVANFSGATLHLTSTTYEFGGDRGNITVLSVKPPAQMDIHGLSGPNAGRTIKAIYAISGEELTVCYQLGAGERPREFSSPNGSSILVVKYLRQH